MSNLQISFIKACIGGDALLNEIEDYIEKWHNDPNDLGEVYEFLGMTRDEYFLWLEDPQILPFVVDAHKRGITVQQSLEEFNRLPLAARAANDEEARRIVKWLKRTGEM